MRGLLKVLSPFAPDQSGAAAVLYDMGCITVICDAGGCTGNVCGFDEPRWFRNAKPIFSAGLRDMDAILGRDDRLVDKLRLVAEKTDADFAAIIGTPVPAVIATDFRALKRMAEKRCGMPIVTCECTGTRLYDIGEEEAYMQLVKTFADLSAEAYGESRIIGVLGVTPLNISSVEGDELIRQHYKSQGYDEVYCYGMGAGLNELRQAGRAEKNLVVAPSGLKAARYLEKKFGTPYELHFPLIPVNVAEAIKGIRNARVCVIHQQFAAETVRQQLEKKGCEVTVASFFELKKDLRREQDVALETEEDYQKLIEEGGFDYVIADELFRRAVSADCYKEWIPMTHFAVSGKLEEAQCAL